MHQPHIVIVGGGLSGLAAASALVTRGCSLTLLESRPRLGGRASSFLDKTSGEWIDNCQHVSLGCCTNFQHFCQTTGIDSYLRTESKLNFIGRDGVVNSLGESSLPPPLHLALAFNRMSYLSVADKWGIAIAIRQLCRWKPESKGPPTVPEESFLDWLHQQHQTPTAIERFWNVILTSALSETLDRIDIGHARKVIVDGFLRNRSGWRMQVPTIPLDQFYGYHLRSWLEEHGGRIRLQAGVEGVDLSSHGPSQVILRNGERLAADQIILALSPRQAADLLPFGSPLREQLQSSCEMESAPITSVHLWFDREITRLPHTVLVDRLSQWIFSRTQLQQKGHSPRSGYYFQVVISASRSLKGRDQDSIIKDVLTELEELWPETAAAQLLHSRIVTEHQAVFSVKPGVESHRLSQQTIVPSLHLAGDWTKTGWPGTMEGAVRSGYLAAESVLRQKGTPQTLLQPDLPTSWLSRLLLGLES